MAAINKMSGSLQSLGTELPPPAPKQWFVDKGPMGAGGATALQTLTLKEPHDPALYRGRKPHRGCFPLLSHGRSLLAQVASNRLRQGVALPGVQLFRGFNSSYDHVQVAGLNQKFDALGQLPHPMVWLMTHTREPDDGMLMGGLHGVLPLAADGRGGHRLLPRFVMRKSNSSLETFSKFLGMGCFSVNVASADRQRPGDKAANARVLKTLNGQLAKGDHPHIFVEAKIRGDGTIQVPEKSGAVMVCREVVKPPRGVFRRRPALRAPVTMMPVALTYEVFGRDKPVAMFSTGPTFCISGEGAAVAHDLERMLARSNTLSMSGIVGSYLLERLNPGAGASLLAGEDRGPVCLSAQRIEALVRCTVQALLAGQDSTRSLSLNEVAMDAELLDARKLQGMAQKTFEQLQARGICNAQGVVQPQAVGPRANMAKPLPFKEQPFNVHRDQPLRYWGNRVLQQAHAMPELFDLLRNVYANAAF